MVGHRITLTGAWRSQRRRGGLQRGRAGGGDRYVRNVQGFARSCVCHGMVMPGETAASGGRPPDCVDRVVCRRRTGGCAVRWGEGDCDMRCVRVNVAGGVPQTSGSVVMTKLLRKIVTSGDGMVPQNTFRQGQAKSQYCMCKYHMLFTFPDIRYQKLDIFCAISLLCRVRYPDPIF